MRVFLAIIKRDIKLAAHSIGDMLTLILFFIMVGVLVPIAIGPDKEFLANIAPGIMWIAAFLSSLLALDRIFRPDHEDGSLLAMRHSAISFELIIFAKLIAHWISAILPLILATPMMALMLNMDMRNFINSVISLIVGTPALIAFGAVGAAITVSLKRGGLIAPVLILPLSLPILIFGVSSIKINVGAGTQEAALLILAAISLIAVSLTPFATALALRLTQE